MDVDDLRTEPNGEDFVRDDVRLGGAVADVGYEGAQRARHIEELVQDNTDAIEKLKND